MKKLAPTLFSFVSLSVFVAASLSPAMAQSGSSADVSAAPRKLQAAKMSPIQVVGDHFERDGKPYQIISGTLHYPRIPRAYWRDRLRKARAMGLNTVETYVFWNLHEPRPGVFDFSGQLDVAAFVRTAQEEGLNVILRPGPYICAEWEAGGFPAWLYADPSIKVRTSDPRFLAAADQYLEQVGQQLASLQASRGGPIIMVQIENEYGSFGHDREYMQDIRQSLVKAGFGGSLLFTSDGPDGVANDALPGVLAVINFGAGGAKAGFQKLAALRPAQPMMNGEYWDGWFDHWGGKHAATDAQKQADEIAWMLGKGYSVNIYPLQGGTSFGFMNGANWDSGDYQPDVTSYDYDAAIDEAGRPTKKFELFRDVIQRSTGITPPPLPAPLPIVAVPSFTFGEATSLWDNLPAPVSAEHPRSMETFGQSYGYILYRTELRSPIQGDLALDDLRDYAAVYLDRKLVGTLDRRLKQAALPFSSTAAHATLDILVENTGRINFGPSIQDGQAGITKSVTLGGKELTGWKVYSLPMESPNKLTGWKKGAVDGPAFHRGSFTISETADTFLDVSKLGKGFVWVNGHNLGRVWNVGPQEALYVPGSWLRKGKNDVVEFDYATLSSPELRGVVGPIWSAVEGRK
ncbi:MAG: glycoside hydrolase family 35 protein [Acidobacteriaceae bacterium]